MICSVIRDLIRLYDENKSGNKIKKIVYEHIENCTNCKEFYNRNSEEIKKDKLLNIDENKENVNMELQYKKYRNQFALFMFIMVILIYIIFAAGIFSYDFDMSR